MAKYNIFTDGACSGNGTEFATAGWSLIICNEKFEQLASYKGRVIGKQTNNRAELSAILSAFRWIRDNISDGDNITIYSDSEICIKMIAGECKRIKNRDIWEEIESICPNVTNKAYINAVHTQAHMCDSTNIIHVLNNEADRLAKNASRALL